MLASVRTTGLTLVLEPGRWLVGPAGVIVTQVVDLKPESSGAGASPRNWSLSLTPV